MTKALSLTQPWASLVVWGFKRNETRSWGTTYRGTLVIHASKGFPREAIELCFDEPFSQYLRLMGIEKPADLPRGVVLGTVELTDCLRIDAFFDAGTVTEDAFGDYSLGRYAWKLRNPQRLATPVGARGSLGLWEWTP